MAVYICRLHNLKKTWHKELGLAEVSKNEKISEQLYEVLGGKHWKHIVACESIEELSSNKAVVMKLLNISCNGYYCAGPSFNWWMYFTSSVTLSRSTMMSQNTISGKTSS